jgi:hypothetical protein
MAGPDSPDGIALNARQRIAFEGLTHPKKPVRKMQLLGAGGTGKTRVMEAYMDWVVARRGGAPMRVTFLAFKALVAHAAARPGIVTATMHSFLGLQENQRVIPTKVTMVFKERAAAGHRLMLGGDRPSRHREMSWAVYVIDEHAVMDARLLRLFLKSVEWLRENYGVQIRTILAAGDYTQAECFGQCPVNLFSHRNGWRTAALVENNRFRPAEPGPEAAAAAADLEAVCAYLRDTRCPAGGLSEAARAREVRALTVIGEMLRRPAGAVNPARVLTPAWYTANRYHNDRKCKRVPGWMRFVAELHETERAEDEAVDDPKGDPALSPVLAEGVDVMFTKNMDVPTEADPGMKIRVNNGTRGVVGAWPQYGMLGSAVSASKVRGLDSKRSGPLTHVPVEVDGVWLMVHAVRLVAQSGAVWAMPLQPTYALTAAKVQGETITEPYAIDMTKAPNKAANRLLYVMMSRGTSTANIAMPTSMHVDDVARAHANARFDPEAPRNYVERAVAMQLALEDAASA